jgi:hypothetical protein
MPVRSSEGLAAKSTSSSHPQKFVFCYFEAMAWDAMTFASSLITQVENSVHLYKLAQPTVSVGGLDEPGLDML